MSERRGLLIVISGPSGVGKDTVIKRLLEVDPNLRYSVSYTTRRPRPGEVDGVNYHFVSREEFERLIREGAFLEHATYGGNLYGTPFAQLDQERAAGRDIVLKIDVQGAEQVRWTSSSGGGRNGTARTQERARHGSASPKTRWPWRPTSTTWWSTTISSAR